MKRLLLIVVLLGFGAVPVQAVDTAWVVTTDYSSFGRIRAMGGAAPWTVSADLATIPGDAVARHHEGLVYVVGRGGANLVQVYNPAASFALVREFSLGAGRNLQDIAFDTTGEAYISCYDQALLLRVDVASETILASYSTAAYADSDGLPETSWMRAVGDKLYITCQKLDRDNWYAPSGSGQLLVFDMASEEFEAPIDLIGADPYTQIETVPDGNGGVDLRVGCAGFFGLADGGIETIDRAAGVSLGYDATEAELGGDVTAFATAGDALYVLISDASFITSLRRYDLVTGAVTVVATGTGYVHADVVFDGGSQLVVADRTSGASGLRVYDANSGAELTTGALPTGLPPFMIVLPEADIAAPVPPQFSTGGLAVGTPFPNPCNPRAEMVLTGRSGATVGLTVFDLRGHRVFEEARVLDSGGQAVWAFQGVDFRGRNLPAGVYRVVAQSGTGYAARSITLIK